ncbi:JNK1/MAPK8-associated membrane protein isoform X2 [Arctopsyche grandis]|uniref:JNK1/MAPK8-associated membrane protein isoform X2 n=1 Tax=Arctopsyche grandis TaxID=121162 RepID=UPI00406D865D
MIAPTCPGLYCGRMQTTDDNWGSCGACPRGFRTNLTSHCVPCDHDPLLYDWMYLGFMALLVLVLHWFFIDMVSKRANRDIVAMHMCALMEVVTACLVTLFLSEPVGSLAFKSCRVSGLSDWYTLLHNPTPNYETTLHCTQEAVYPLYTLVLIMYGLCVVLLMVIRCFICSVFFKVPNYFTLAVYHALYFLPILVFIHAVAAGLIYYSYPYIIIILSMMSSAAHFSTKPTQTTEGLLYSSVCDLRNAVILIGHWLLHAYGIISVTGFKDPVFHGPLLALVPAPAAFYIITAPFTDPSKFHND